jgi:hypothetical protein
MVCGSKMVRNGRTKAGAQRWRCKRCGSSYTHHIDTSAKELKIFLKWLLSRKTEAELGMNPRTFRRMAAKYWKIWPICFATGECHDVVVVDGIWLSRKAVLLIACTKDEVLGWYVAQSECSAAWSALLAKLVPPKMVVTDGGQGFVKAARIVWPQTKIQRCTFHAYCQVKRETTSHPKLEAGQELLAIATELTRVQDSEAAAKWLSDYSAWCLKWDEFLDEYTFDDHHNRQYTHYRLRKARQGLNKLVKDKRLFTFIEMTEAYGGSWPSTSNWVEGSINSQLREVIHQHKGMPLIHRIKAMCWWCYFKSSYPKDATWIIKNMPTDEQASGLYKVAGAHKNKQRLGPEEIGIGVDWSEYHSPTEYRP